LPETYTDCRQRWKGRGADNRRRAMAEGAHPPHRELHGQIGDAAKLAKRSGNRRRAACEIRRRMRGDEGTPARIPAF
jgi:hypothetical protein